MTSIPTSTTASISTLPRTHRALVQTTHYSPPTVTHLPTPTAHPGAILLRVLSAKLLSYTRDIYNGRRAYPYPVPLTLGSSALCRVAALPVDSTYLKEGDLVLYDCTIRSRDNPEHVFLHAITEGGSEGSKKLFRECWRDGTYAEYVKVPLENVFRLDEKQLLGSVEDGGLGYQLDDLMPVFTAMVPYGGLADVGLRAGETVIVAPATGSFGGMAVKVALAIGAGRVIAMGRDEEQLKQVVKEGKGRVVSVKMTGDCEEEVSELKRYGPADVFFDISPPQAWESSHFKAGILALRPKGRVSLMGGQQQDIEIPIRKIMRENIALKGTWMYERGQVREVIKMVESGVLKMRDGQQMKCAGKFALEDWKEAFDLAAETGAKGYVLLKP